MNYNCEIKKKNLQKHL